MKLLLAALLGFSAVSLGGASQGDAEISIKYAATCGVGFLRKSQSPRISDPETFYGGGDEGNRWDRSGRRPWGSFVEVSFRHASVEISPSSGRHFSIPGCMRLVIRNVTVERRIENIAAEYQMRIAGRPDPTRPKMDCAANKGTSLNECTCGTRNNCLFCSFCENIGNRQLSQRRDSRRMSLLDGDSGRAQTDKCGESCPRTEEPGLLDMTADICTPETREMRRHLSADAAQLLGERKMSMFTAVFLYERKGRNRAASTVRNMDVVGCFLLGYDVAVSEEFKRKLAQETLDDLYPGSTPAPFPPRRRSGNNRGSNNNRRKLRVIHADD